MTTYVEFFAHLTGNKPYPWQVKLAEGPWPDAITAPTGTGKTAAVAVAWLWRRLHRDPSTPRRLVWCLPMRALVEQTWVNLSRWLDPLSRHPLASGREAPNLFKLMGGENIERWELYPETDTILVGTQDLLLSRALNRGYAMSRYQWPWAFGLLNNDCLWVYDEVQLMAAGRVTSTQLQGLRRRFGTGAPCHSMWMSATLDVPKLHSVDFPPSPEGLKLLGPGDEDRRDPALLRRVEAPKTVWEVPQAGDNSGVEVAALAPVILAKHRPGTRTLVVVNRVKRAQELYAALRKTLPPEIPCLLLHSRFRPVDRENIQSRVGQEVEQVIVATQVVEAGLDLSATTLITDLAPWSSLVQRMGRCNRTGEETDAAVYWIDVGEETSPYHPLDLQVSRGLLRHCEGQVISSSTLPPAPPSRVEVVPTLRARDLMDLFDTSPDLGGYDLDISRFVRGGDDTDVSVFFRELTVAPSPDTPGPTRSERVAVSYGSFLGWLKTLDKEQKRGNTLAWAWRYDSQAEKWVTTTSARPGEVYLLASGLGGYSPELGFTGVLSPTTPVPEVTESEGKEGRLHPDGLGHDPSSLTGVWVELGNHLKHVQTEAEKLTTHLATPEPWRSALIQAAAWHDVGKAHPCWQEQLRGAPPGEDTTLWAKSGQRWEVTPVDLPEAESSSDRAESVPPKADNRARRGLRHELASLLSWLQLHPDAPQTDLTGWLIVTHHGKIRLSLRRLPGESLAPGDLPAARGVWDGDEFPREGKHFCLPDGTPHPVITVNLHIAQMGAGSWLDRATTLLHQLGPFVLPWLEAQLRTADARASMAETQGLYQGDL